MRSIGVDRIIFGLPPHSIFKIYLQLNFLILYGDLLRIYHLKEVHMKEILTQALTQVCSWLKENPELGYLLIFLGFIFTMVSIASVLKEALR
jgi:hypothetical protein